MQSLESPRRALAAAALVATSSAAVAAGPSALAAQDGDIVETAVAAGSFNTLATALETAGLVETLQGEGPFTVFAPTDEAFAALPDGTVGSLLQPENRDALVAVLTYPVVPGRVTASQVVELDEATTVNGADVRIGTRDGGVQINESNVVATDVLTTNGMIHVIDQLLLPPEWTEDRAQAPESEPEVTRLAAPPESRRRWSYLGRLGRRRSRGGPLVSNGLGSGLAAVRHLAPRLRYRRRGPGRHRRRVGSGDRDERYPVDGGVFDMPPGEDAAEVPIQAKLAVAEPTLFAVTVEEPGGVVVSSRERGVRDPRPGPLPRSRRRGRLAPMGRLIPEPSSVGTPPRPQSTGRFPYVEHSNADLRRGHPLHRRPEGRHGVPALRLRR